MAQVHTFGLVTEIFTDTRVPIQYLGGGNSPAARQFTLALLLEFVQANLGLSASETVSTSTYQYDLPAGKWLLAIAVQSASSQSFDCGLAADTDEIIQDGPVTGGGGPATFGTLLFGGLDGLSIYFSSLTGTSTVTFLVI